MGEVFLKLLNMSITAGWMIVAILCIRLLFRKMPKWVNCLLWGVVAVRLIFPFSIESIFSLQPSAEPIQTNTVVSGEVLPYVPSVDSNLSVVENTINPILAESFAYEQTDSVAPLQVFTEIAGVVWVVGLIVLLGFAVVSMVRLAIMVKESVPYKDNAYICDAVKSPFILGIIRPRIFLSSSLTEEEMEYIMAHEKAHLKRKDHLWKPFGYLLLSVYWFNPLCWIAYIMLCKDIELACDEKVIRDMNFADKKEYSRVLLSCATQGRLVMACPVAFGEVGVKERVKTVLNYKRPAFLITVVAIVVCVIVAICFLTNPKKECQIRITIPAGSTEEIVYQEDFFYSDEEISPTGNKITISLGEGIGDTQVVLKSVEVKEENAYEPTYITPGMSVKMDVEKGAWFKIGVNMQNPTTEDIHVYVVVKGVEVRISDQADNEQEIGEAEENMPADTQQSETLATMQNLVYYLEFSEPDLEFQNMSDERRMEILYEYDELLAEYTLMARESTDGKTEYVVGCYEGEVSNSPLYQMQTYEVSHKSSGSFQILYLEENYEKLDQIISTEGVSAIKDEGYALGDSHIFWTTDKKYIMIVPVSSEEDLSQTFGHYYYVARGPAYIEDAINRGIALNNVKEPYLTVYMISEKYGEISERIELSEGEVEAILAEKPRENPVGIDMVASLTVNGENIYFGGKDVPQSVLELVVERCGYRFETPKDITSPIIGARLDCNWLDEPLYADAEDLSRLEEILKGAKHTGVGNCGYGAKLTITLENKEEQIIFKGTDDCGSLVFGSYGGYSISDEADDEFWEIFGLPASTEERFVIQQENNMIEPKTDPLETAILNAIVGKVSDYPSGLYHCASFVELHREQLCALAPATGGVSKETLIVYGMAMEQSFSYSDGKIEEYGGSHMPVVITFEVKGDTYIETDYWMPGDGSYYNASIRDKFPDEVEEDALDTQKYVMAQIQACYSRAVQYYQVDTEIVIDELFDKIEDSPASASNPVDYIEAHSLEYRELMYYGEYSLNYVFEKFIEGDQTGLRGQLMRALLDDLAPEAQLRLYAETGQEYFDEWAKSAERVLEQHDIEWLKANQPAMWLYFQKK